MPRLFRSDRWVGESTGAAIAIAAVLVVAGTPARAAADGCPAWAISGNVGSGDGSTIPGAVEIWNDYSNDPWGAHPAGPVTFTGFTGSNHTGNQWYGINGNYFTSPKDGTYSCHREAGDPCGSCSGGFDLKLYAKQGAMEGTLTVKPAVEHIEALSVWTQLTPGGTAIPASVDPQGHFSFRSTGEPGYSNNWGVAVTPSYAPYPHSGMGQATYVLGLQGAPAVKTALVKSSQLTDASFTVAAPRTGGGGQADMRGGTGGGGCGGGGGGQPPGEPGGGPGSGPGMGGGPPPSTPPGSCPPGKPVDAPTGNVFFDQTDVSVPGIQGLVFQRSYNSKLAYDNIASGFGRGWTHTYSRALSFPDARSIDLRGDDGVPIYFQDLDGDGRFDAVLPSTHRSWITREGAGYVRHYPGGANETYDATGRLERIVDVGGNTTLLSRDDNGRLHSVLDAGGRELVLEYGAAGRIASLSVGTTVVASYAYDGSVAGNRLETVRYPDGSGYAFTSDSYGQILAVDDAAGRPIERHAYGAPAGSSWGVTSELADGRERLTLAYENFKTTVDRGAGGTTTYDWEWVDGLRRVTKVTGPCPSCGTGGEETKEWDFDGQGHVVRYQRTGQGPTLYTYGSQGLIESVEDPLGRTTSYTYDQGGRVLTTTSPGGGLVTYTYGPFGPLTVSEKLTATTSRTTTYTYTALGQVHTVTDPRSKTTTYAYTPAGDLESVTDPLGHATTFGYDPLGRRTTVTDAAQHTSTTTYDGRGRATRVSNPDQTHTDFVYDLSGHRVRTTDPLGRTTRWIYDGYGLLSQVVDPLNGTTSYEYDLDGQLTALTDAKDQKTVFEHDTTGRVVKVTYPGSAYESFTYDAAGRLWTKTDRRAIVTTYTYDDLGRLAGKSYSNGDPAVSYTYDSAGRLETAANGTDTLSWTYDLAGQLLTEQSARNASNVSYGYDPAGNRQTLNLNGQLFLSYGYDDASRLTSITRGASVFGFAYDAVNRRTSMSYPNAVTTSYTYDDLSRLTSLNAVLNGTTPITSFAYTYDAAGNRLTKAQDGFTEGYAYDPLYRLTAVERTGSLSGRWHFDYDAVGNRTTAQTDSSVTTSSYNEKNQLVQSAGGGSLRVRGTLDEPGTATVNGQPAQMRSGNVFEATIQASTGTNTFTVAARDTSGNVTTKGYQVEVGGAGASYSYDANGNLTQKVDGADTWTYEWNAENQLKRVTKNGLEQARFAYDPNGRRVEKVAGGITTSYGYDSEDIVREIRGAATFKYVHGSGNDEPLAREEGTGPLTYYHADGLGTIVKRTSQVGAVLHEYRYDSWGHMEAGSAEPGYAFTGREWDPETELYYYRARYYDPDVGVFTSEDPAAFPGTAGAYAYVAGNPVSWRDPTGLWKVSPNARAKPDENTIVCQDNRVVIQIHQDPIREACGLSGCTREHEQRHVEQVMAANARICEGMPNGARVLYSSYAEERAMEGEASCEVSVPCLRKLLDKKKCPAGCEDMVRAELDVMESECRRHGGNPAK